MIDSRLIIAMLIVVIIFCVIIIFQINSIYNIEIEKDRKINTLTEIINDLRYLQELEIEVMQKLKEQEEYNQSIKEIYIDTSKNN